MTSDSPIARPGQGLIAAALEQEVRRKVQERGVVVWLDRDGHYTAFADDLIRRHEDGEVAEPVVGFRGSFLELLLALEPHAGGLDSGPLLVHLPGFNKETVRATPLLELYELGFPYLRSLETLVREVARGRAAADEVEQFLAAPGLSLAAADAWLAGHLGAKRQGVAGLLEETGLTVVTEQLLGADTFLAARLDGEPACRALAEYLDRQTGLDTDWLRFCGGRGDPATAADLTAAFGAWLLSVEYVHDLTRPPHLPELQRLRQLSPPLVAVCGQLCAALRDRYPERYAALADDVELLLAGELRAIRAEDLGRIDTLRVEEASVLAAAIAACRQGDWSRAEQWAAARGDASFWIRHEPTRRFAWTLVTAAAELGAAIAADPHPLQGARDLAEALERYCGRAHAVDRRHRRFEQLQLALLEPRLPHFGELKEVVAALRRAHRIWVDDLTRDFTALCCAHGFLPPPELQQRTLYEQAVQPLAAKDRVALFVVDALRFEMAAELAEALRGRGTQVDLRGRFAELPTITAVGMNALAPVASNGQLVLASSEGFAGFRTGEYAVRKPDDRARAMGMRSLGKMARSFTLAEVSELDAAALKRRIGGEGLIVVQSREIDDAGEANVGLATFDLTLRQLESAWHHLQACGIRHFVFTADHGFLLQDATTAVKPYGTRRDPSRRHVLADEARAEDGMVHVSLRELAYQGPGGESAPGYLLFRDDSAVFATGTAGASFVHGGNSLQERVIPVLTVSSRRAVGAGIAAHVIEARAGADVLGMHRLALRLVPAPQSGLLPLGTPAPIDLALRVPERDEVHVIIKDVAHLTLRGSRFAVPVREQWAEVFFTLEGPVDERVRIEVIHPDAVENVGPCLVDGWFSVAGRGGAPAVAGPAVGLAAGWQEGFADDGVRQIFVHLHAHGSITEVEVTRLLGSPRAFRRFALDFDEHVRRAPFRVRIESTASGKRYVKEGEA